MSQHPASPSGHAPSYPCVQLGLLAPESAAPAALSPLVPPAAASPAQAALASPQALLSLLAQWSELGWLRTVDLVFTRFLLQQQPQTPASVLLAAALARAQLGRGHVCLDVQAASSLRGWVSLTPRPSSPQDGLPGEQTAAGLGCPPADLLAALPLADWLAALQDSVLVDAGAGAAPLVLQGSRLYLRRYWQYEQDVLRGVQARLARASSLRQATPVAWIAQGLQALFGAAPGTGAVQPDWQRMACALMSCSAFGVITGGPGTGKTTTVLRLLALLQSLALRPSPAAQSGLQTVQPLRICLAAPTGKAAARLQESIAAALHRLDLSGLDDAERIRSSIPTGVTTLHRLLGSRPDSRRLHHDARNPLALDVLVIDEASMIDLEMMAAVLAALPAQARLLLLGDKDQLSSVEAGAVLGSLCARAQSGHYLAQTAAWLHSVGAGELPAALQDRQGWPLDQAVAMLRHSYRFDAHSGIGRLAQTVNQGDQSGLRRLLQQQMPDLALLPLPADDDTAALARLVVDGAGDTPAASASASASASTAAAAGRCGYRHYLEQMRAGQPAPGATRSAYDEWASQVLAAYGEFQVLCALRQGRYGVEGLNLRIAQLLDAAGLIERALGPWYMGRPVLVTRNDYSLGLMNGDVGITLALPQTLAGERESLSPRVAFARADGSAGIRWVLPSRLQAAETVYAMTVHKSQGSEFGHAALVLPDRPSPVLTRELIYTGITRARRCFTLAGPAQAGAAGAWAQLEQAVGRTVQRAGGLAQGWDD
jgi:exodeoxyribonuclease V alpha subunit